MKMLSIFTTFFILLVSNTISAITQTRAADVLNLNGIEDSNNVVTERGLGPRHGPNPGPDKSGSKSKDASVTESQENRSFFKPDADRRGGSFYPSGPPLSSGPNYHTSGTGYSYGAPSGPGPNYPPPSYNSYPSSPGPLPSLPSSPSSAYGAGLGGGHPLLSLGGHGGSGHGGGPPGHHHAMMLKGLLLPIAGVALLGAAAVLAKSNPVLLQLGVVSGKRRRRSLNTQDHYPPNPFVTPE